MRVSPWNLIEKYFKIYHEKYGNIDIDSYQDNHVYYENHIYFKRLSAVRYNDMMMTLTALAPPTASGRLAVAVVGVDVDSRDVRRPSVRPLAEQSLSGEDADYFELQSEGRNHVERIRPPVTSRLLVVGCGRGR